MTDLNEALQGMLADQLKGFQKLISCDQLSEGASLETFRITIQTDRGERRLAMRRSPGGVPNPNQDTGPGLMTEARLMQAARDNGVPAPEIFIVSKADDPLGEAIIMEWLDGITLGAKVIRSEELDNIRPQLAYECGRTIAKIHAIDLEASGLGEFLNTVDTDTMINDIWDGYEMLNTPQPMIDFSARWLKENLPRNPRQTLVHNDFRNGNIMFSAAGIVAVLDWELSYIGDPMRDLGWICTNSWRFGKTELTVGGFGHYDELFRGYEEVSGMRVDYENDVKFWEVYGSFWWSVGCLRMAERFRSGPDRTVERPAIGRRSSECQVDCVNLLIPGKTELVGESDFAASSEMPRIDELVASVRDFLREEVMKQIHGRTGFMARVASNSLDIVLREISLGEECRRLEHDRLWKLLGLDGSLELLRWKLVEGLRDESIPLDHPGLADHLRATVVNQMAIDQPRYSGFRTALKNAGLSGEGR